MIQYQRRKLKSEKPHNLYLMFITVRHYDTKLLCQNSVNIVIDNALR